MADKPGFLEELKRRHVWRVAVAYAVAGWLLVQVATQVFPIFHMPDWTAQIVVILVVIGFPVAVVLAWVYEVTPEGVRRTEPADSPNARPQATTHQIARKLNVVIVAVLILAVALLGWRLLVLRRAASSPNRSPDVAQRNPGQAIPDSAAGATASGLHVAPTATANPLSAEPAAFHPPADTIVVLPFENLGGDKSQQYFSDGITEELTNALGQNTGLRVIAWDTASKFRDGTQSATDIGKQLDVANVLSGKILRQGNEVRVIVELVNATNGYQVWSHHYDDSLKNIFTVQDRITQSIAGALKVKFASLQPAQTVNPEAHDLVLKGLAAMNSRGAASYEQARKDFEQAVAIAPDYAAAHAGLARTIYDLTQYTTLSLKEALPQVRAEAHKALALDPNNVSAIIALANADAGEGNTAKAMAGYQRAIKLDPNNAIARLNYASLLPPRQGLAEALKAVQLDPQNVIAQNNLAVQYLDLGEYAQALPASQAMMRLVPHSADAALGLAQNYALLHQDETAVKAFDQVQPDTALDKQLVAAGKLAYQSVLNPSLHAQALAAANALHQRADLDPLSQGDLMGIYLVLGDKRVALDLLDKLCELEPAACDDLTVNPTYIPLRGDPRFEALVKKYAIPTTAPASAATAHTP